METDMTETSLWIGIGLTGQLLFTSRFLVQWIASERRRESVIPVAFWWFSLAGGVTLLSYALWRRDPVFILGQAMGLVVYARNLVLIHARNRGVSA
nr:lipid-A-disaccharide synthase N-terminal domain-containing protein [Paracoccus chinensis]